MHRCKTVIIVYGNLIDVKMKINSDESNKHYYEIYASLKFWRVVGAKYPVGAPMSIAVFALVTSY